MRHVSAVSWSSTTRPGTRLRLRSGRDRDHPDVQPPRFRAQHRSIRRGLHVLTSTASECASGLSWFVEDQFLAPARASSHRALQGVKRAGGAPHTRPGMTEQRDRVEINWVQVSASALAAVSSAVLLSTVGVAGTIIGAAIGSLFATAGSSIYSHYLRISQERVARAQTAALERVSRARASVSGAAVDVRRGGPRTQALRVQREVEQAGDELAHAERELQGAEGESGRPPWREILTGLPWKRISVGAAGVFVVAMLAIVSFELLTGRAVSSYTGGSDPGARTSVPGLGRSHASSTPTPTPSGTPTSGASSAGPSADSSRSADPSGSPPGHSPGPRPPRRRAARRARRRPRRPPRVLRARPPPRRRPRPSRDVDDRADPGRLRPQRVELPRGRSSRP